MGPRFTVSRRRLLATAAGTIAVPVIAACNTSASTVDTTNPEAVRGKIVHWSNASFPFNEDIGADFVREFKQKYPNIQYETDLIVGDRFEKMVASAAAGTMPDIGMSTPYQVQEQGLKGIARAHDDFMKTSRVVKQADLWPSLTYDLIYKGKQYAMPFAPDVRVMYVNNNVMQAAGIDPTKPAKRYDRIPVKIKVAEGQAYQENDPFLKLAVEEMRMRKFHIPAPGGGEIQALHVKIGTEGASGQRPIREVLKDYSTQMQLILDKFKGM